MPCTCCRFRCLLSVLLFVVTCSGSLTAAEPDPVYAWKPNDVLRFEFVKTITIEEDASADEVCSDQPTTLLQNSVQLIEFKRPDDDSSDDIHRLGTPKIVATYPQGSHFTFTGVMKEDERHAKWVEVRDAKDVTGFIPGTTKVRDRREFSFDAILIIEIKNLTPAGTFAVLHFDSAHIVMPETYTFLPQVDDPGIQKERAKTIIHAIEGAIKVARWNVTLDSTGVVHIDTRVPKGLDDWLKETEHSAFWRGRLRKLWMEIVDKNLGLAATGDDTEMFLSLTGPSTPPVGELQKIRTFRSKANLVSNQNDKAQYRFQHLPPIQAGQPFVLPYIGPPEDPKTPNVYMTFKPEMKGPLTESDPTGSGPQIGTAMFDTNLKMLDWIKEAYSFETDYTCDEDKRRHYKVSQKVSVKYSLKRLAPKINGDAETLNQAPTK